MRPQTPPLYCDLSAWHSNWLGLAQWGPEERTVGGTFIVTVGVDSTGTRGEDSGRCYFVTSSFLATVGVQSTGVHPVDSERSSAIEGKYWPGAAYPRHTLLSVSLRPCCLPLRSAQPHADSDSLSQVPSYPSSNAMRVRPFCPPLRSAQPHANSSSIST